VERGGGQRGEGRRVREKRQEEEETGKGGGGGGRKWRGVGGRERGGKEEGLDVGGRGERTAGRD